MIVPSKLGKDLGRALVCGDALVENVLTFIFENAALENRGSRQSAAVAARLAFTIARELCYSNRVDVLDEILSPETERKMLEMLGHRNEKSPS